MMKNKKEPPLKRTGHNVAQKKSHFFRSIATGQPDVILTNILYLWG